MVIQVNMLCGDDKFLKIVLNISQFIHNFTLMMIIYQDNSPCDLIFSFPLSFNKFLADKILTSRSSIEGERKPVTVFFADVANFTSISEKLDPEGVHQIMDGCFKILMEEIHKHEKTNANSRTSGST